MTVYLDSDSSHDLVTRRSITGIIFMISNKHIKWISKRQKTAKTSTYGSELVVSRDSMELILEVKYML
jgi:hypothetical protein